jgi:transposase InsO family protein
MLENEDLLAWFQRHRLPECARAIINQIRSSEPARRVGGGKQNVSGRYPSKKMGVIIQFESHRVELARIYELEHDPEVLEYWDQPPSFKLDYESAHGKRVVAVHTPDYFVMRVDGAGWEECKREDELLRWAERSPHRFRRDDDIWHCPPGEEYARKFGLTYSVRSSRDIDWVYQRNIQFLEDYLRNDRISVPPAARNLLLAQVAARPGISLLDLLATSGDGTTCDDVYVLSALGELYVDLHRSPLTQPATVHVFSNRQVTAHDTQNLTGLPKPLSNAPISQPSQGSGVNWDGQRWNVLNCGQTHVVLRRVDDNSTTQLPAAAYYALMKEGQITVTPPRSNDDDCEIMGRLSRASEEDLGHANYRYKIVRGPLDSTTLTAPTSVSSRSARRWRAMYRKAEVQCGSGYLGLIPQTHRRGNRAAKLPEVTRELMATVIHQDYETHKQKSVYASWSALLSACNSQGLIAPSYETFRQTVHAAAGHAQTLKRMGPRAAYTQERFYWELELKTPRHGERPFEIGHVDHTELDVELVCSTTGRNLGRPWLSLLTDAFSRRVLAVSLSFDPPSYRSCMAIIRECVGRYNRIPQIFVVDGGAEFDSVYFETLLARYECTKKTRPPAKARFGSVVERLFGTCNSQFIHNLCGNTQAMRQVRQVTASVNPKQKAVWALADLHDYLTRYLYEVYDSLDHPALGQSPREAYEAGMAYAGQRPWRRINYDREFFIMTLPTTSLGTAQVLPGRGVKIHYIYYWSDMLRDPEIERSHVPVRYDAFDIGTAFAFVKGHWVQCHSEYYAIFRGHSERELMLATQELRKRHREHERQRGLSARTIGDFLQSVEAQEILLAQRLRDRQASVFRSEYEQVVPQQLPTDSRSTSQSSCAALPFQTAVLERPEEYETYGAF